MNYELKNKKKNKNIGTGGFSLIEVLVALAIFTFIIGGIVMFSVNTIKANTRSQAMQEALDNARFTMDDLAKKIRTSSGVKVSGANDEIFFIDNKTLVKYCYRFKNGQMLVSGFVPRIDQNDERVANTDATSYNAVGGCNYWSLLPAQQYPVIGEGSTSKIKIGGKFEVMPTDISSDTDPHRGFVRIVIDIMYNDSGSPENRAETHLQSGVSIADYGREDDFELEANSL